MHTVIIALLMCLRSVCMPMCLRSVCSLNKLPFGEKVQNQPVGRCQGFAEKGQTIIRKESRKLPRRRPTLQFA